MPGGLRIRSGAVLAPPPPPPPAPDVAPPQVVPPDAGATRARAAELTRLVVEVLAGRRTPEQLTGLAAPRVLRYLGAARAAAVARPTLATAGRGGRAGAPGCSTAPPPRAARVHVMQPHPDAAEVCATPTVAGRPRAVVLRLDRRSGDAPWTVTAVRLL
nr:Rv3235 family protein [Pseudonocardia sp. C8]